MRVSDARQVAKWKRVRAQIQMARMQDTKKTGALGPGEFPRRVRLSILEIGVAVALTLAAAVQLWFALGARERVQTEQAAQTAGGQPSGPRVSTP